jgi:hypothetical protein
MSRSNLDWSRPESVAENDADPAAADAGTNDLPKRLVVDRDRRLTATSAAPRRRPGWRRDGRLWSA